MKPGLRRIAVLTTGRQDWGILRSTCIAMAESPDLEITLLVGGMHLSDRHGRTVDLIRGDGFSPAAELDWLSETLEEDPPASHQAGRALELVAAALRENPVDALVLVGDRLETAAAALAATLERVPIVHLHGGEVTEGAFDDQLRNAITKLAHLHLVSHVDYGRRIVAMGEDPATVHVVGSPGLDAAFRGDLPDRSALEQELGRPLPAPLVLVTVHPATLEADPAAVVHPVIAAMRAVPATYVVTLPNPDPGGTRIRRAWLDLDRDEAGAPLVLEALGEIRYWGLMRIADAMLGNSSSGILEAPAIDLPVVNVGDRQAGRRREANVIDCPAEPAAIEAALLRALDPAFRSKVAAIHPATTDGRVGERIAAIIGEWSPPSPPRKTVGHADRRRRPLVVIGGGEHARVVIDAAQASGGWQVKGIVDPDQVERTRALLGVDHLGSDDRYMASAAGVPPEDRAGLVLGIGSGGASGIRRATVARYDVDSVGPWATLVHPSAWVAPTAVLGPGVVVLAGAVVNAGAEIGAHAIVNSMAVIEHDVRVGEFAHVGPRAVVGGGAVIGEDVFAGMGSLVRDHVDVGSGAVIGMGAVVTSDVPAGSTVVGVPARPLEPS